MSDTRHLGLDCRMGESLLVAVDRSGETPEIRTVHRGDNAEVIKAAPESIERTTVAVPDNLALVKPVYVDDLTHADLRRRVQFDLAQSVLEPESAFVFDLIATPVDHHVLGLIYRHSRLDDLRKRCLSSRSEQGVRYFVRGAALGYGYLQFAERNAEGVTGLVDVAGNLVSICLLRDDRIIALAHLTLQGFSPNSDAAVHRFAVELKTVLNFKLAALGELGMTAPLGRILLNGFEPGRNFRDVFSKFFAQGAETIALKEEYKAAFGNAGRPSDFLVALGLAVN